MEGLSPLQVDAIAALMVEPTILRAAKRAGVGERTLRRWLDDHDFRAALRHEQRIAMAAVTARLQRSADKALRTLERILGDRKATCASKVSAARVILDLAHERIDMELLQERIEALEGRRSLQ